MRDGQWPLTAGQRAMVFAARILPPPVLRRLAALAMRISPPTNTAQRGSKNDG
jgi:hypothetical protein